MNDNLQKDNEFRRFRKYYSALEPIWEKPKNRVYTAVIFSFLAISLFAWFAIRPTVQTILYLQREIADKTTVNQKMEQKIADLIATRVALDQVQPQLYLINDAIPDNPEALDATIQIRNIINSTQATLSGLMISSVPLVSADTPIKLPGAIESTDFSINATLLGGYSDLENILNNLNSMRRMISIQSMSFMPGASEPGMSTSINSIKLSIIIKSYYK